MLIRYATIFVVMLLANPALSVSQTVTMRAGQLQDDSKDDEEIRTVSFCELIASPKLFNNKMVRVRATYIANLETEKLYDVNCTSEDNDVWPILGCDSQESCQVLRDKLSRNLEVNPSDGARIHVELVMVGRLNSPQESGRRYGPLDKYRLAFTVINIERVIRIPLNRTSLRCRKKNI